MKAEQRKESGRRGFTLMEMLVVVAIVAVLVAIVIPTVIASLEKSRKAADMADARGILAVLSTGYLDGDIRFTTETFEGHPVCAAVVVSKEGMQCFVSGATEIQGVSYDNSGGAYGHERMQAYLSAAGYDSCTVHSRYTDGDNGWSFYVVFLYSDGTTRVGSGTDKGYSDYRDDTFEIHGENWRSHPISNLEAAMGRNAA